MYDSDQIINSKWINAEFSIYPFTNKIIWHIFILASTYLTETISEGG
nr:hypothetical protein [Escherichia coli]